MRLARYGLQALSIAFLFSCASPEPPLIAPEGQGLDMYIPPSRVDPSIDMSHPSEMSTPIPLAGGDTTHLIRGIGAFVQPAANLSLRRRGGFEAGLQFFQLVWEPAPSRSEIDGLGPTFNARSCIACHQNNGRGGTPSEGRAGMLLRLGDTQGRVDPTYGGQLQTASVDRVPVEGALVAEVDQPFTHHSGVSLTPVRYYADQLSLGPLAAGINQSPRITPQLVGMGLIDAIPVESIIALEDPQDLDQNGVSGRAARDEFGILRFGWKATQRSVLSQCASAFINDMGITSALHPFENCPPAQESCYAESSDNLDIDDVRLQATATYVSLLGVPAHRHINADVYNRGALLFDQVGCADCHHPGFVTGQSVEPELSYQRIWPYSDFLLHDMGDALDDGVGEGNAASAEWRTPPLWGLGLLAEVHGNLHLMHDGRARSIEEAILWHGGEGEAAVSAFVSLSPSQREELINFVNAL